MLKGDFSPKFPISPGCVWPGRRFFERSVLDHRLLCSFTKSYSEGSTPTGRVPSSRSPIRSRQNVCLEEPTTFESIRATARMAKTVSSPSAPPQGRRWRTAVIVTPVGFGGASVHFEKRRTKIGSRTNPIPYFCTGESTGIAPPGKNS